MVDEIIALLRSGWCREVCAKDASGNSCNLASDKACAWCLWGAVNKVLRNPERLMAAHKFLVSKFGVPPGIWNDSRSSVDDVVAFLLLNQEEFELCVSK